MVDPLLSVAFSLYQNKGACALLLGSGVSRAAGIPTGWEVVLDLIGRLAVASGEPLPGAPEGWYVQKYGEQPSYSGLLSKLAPTEAERRLLLRGYFEPTDADSETGKKIPTKAHHAIARLVKEGYVKVILTTNFDRLMERALEQVGVAPTVVSTPDGAKGVLPPHLNACTIVKLNGDYLDTSLKNTAVELAEYRPAVRALLGRILDEYGLIVCGWSGEWDTALRSAIERCRSHRFTTYWTVRGEPKEETKRLMELRRAIPVRVTDADSFFDAVTEKVVSLAEADAPHPLSAKTAVAALKRYVVSDEHRIRLHDLVMEETDRVCARLSAEEFPKTVEGLPDQEIRQRVPRYDAAIETIRDLAATGCYWGEDRHGKLWATVLERVFHSGAGQAEDRLWGALGAYPTFVLLYAAGVACIASGRFELLACLLAKTRCRRKWSEGPLTFALYEEPRFVRHVVAALRNSQSEYVPVSEHLHVVLREPLRGILPIDAQYDEAFNRFEYLHALVHASLRVEAKLTPFWGPLGRFWYLYHESAKDNVVTRFLAEADRQRENWPPLRAGLFGGDHHNFEVIRDSFRDNLLSERPRI